MAIALGRSSAEISPTLTDADILDFCKKGFVVMEGIIPESTNRWIFDYLDNQSSIEAVEDDLKPKALAQNERFIDEVLLHPQVAGVARSLLGKNFQLPDWIANHRLAGPTAAKSWHMDAGSEFERQCNLLQVFYIPQRNTMNMGPTLLMPGSHLVPIPREELDHFGSLASQVATALPAGSVFFTAYPIWHRQAAKTDQSTRNLLKWEFWRTVPPKRDWVLDPDFDFAGADYSYTNDYFSGPTRKWQSVLRVAEMFYWMCGKRDEYRHAGGSGWPFSVSDPATQAKLS